MGKGSGLYRLRKVAPESGTHLVFDCQMCVSGTGWFWGGWGELDDRVFWRYEYEEGGQMLYGDWVEDFFAWLDCELCGVG